MPLQTSSLIPNTPLTPDNGITFLNNGSFVINPYNCRTPPPPLWGTVIEEDLYDKNQPFYSHKPDTTDKQAEMRLQQLIKAGELPDDNSKRYKLKKKVIYTYELDDDKKNKPAATPEGQYIISRNNMIEETKTKQGAKSNAYIKPLVPAYSLFSPIANKTNDYDTKISSSKTRNESHKEM